MKFLEDVNSKLATTKSPRKAMRNYAEIRKSVNERFKSCSILPPDSVLRDHEDVTPDWVSSKQFDWRKNKQLCEDGLLNEKETDNYSGKTVLDLVRLVRNHYIHRNDIDFSENIEEVYDIHPTSVHSLVDIEAGIDHYKYVSYWTAAARFPALMISVWAALEPWKFQLDLVKYYPDDYYFKKTLHVIREN